MKEKFHETKSYYSDMLKSVRNEILGRIQSVLEWLGGKVYVRYYHDEEPDLYRNAFFEMDDDGHGVELFIESIEITETGEVEVTLQDSEDCYSYVWDLSDFNASNAYYLLDELENIAEYVQENNVEVVREKE